MNSHQLRLFVLWLSRSSATLLALFACNHVAFATVVGGFITSDTHWQIADSPFIASSSVLVDGAARLTIDPGVEVRFAPTTGLVIVDGILSARGTTELPIMFRADQAGDLQRWNGIRLGANTADAIYDTEGGFLDGSILEHVDLTGVASHSNGSIRIESSNPFIHSSVIHNNLSSAISVTGANGLRIGGNKLHNNAVNTNDGVWGGGIVVNSSASVIISDNEITNNSSPGGSGIYVHASDDVLITDNLIESNKGYSSIEILYGQEVALTRNTILGHGPRNPSPQSSVAAISMNGGSDIVLLCNLVSGNNSVAAIQVMGSNRITLQGDEISNNQGDGIRLLQNVRSAVLSQTSVNPTAIFGNTGLAIRNDQLFEVTTDPLARGNVDARKVWWGTTDMGSIEESVLDFFDDSFKGIVFLDPIASANPIDGDYNLDNVVDAGDYVAWRDALGAAFSAGDYEIWRANFGSTATSGSILITVPEPTTGILVAACALMMSFRRLRSSNR